MARRRRAQQRLAASGVLEHPWERPRDLAEAREVYMAARDRAGAPPLALPDETLLDTSRRLRGAPAQSLWNAARFDPDPAVRESALVEAVAVVRDELAGELHRCLFGPPWMRTREPEQSPRTKIWATHGIGRWNGPLAIRGHVVMLALRDEPAPEFVEPLRETLEAFIAEAAAVGLRVEPQLGGAIEATTAPGVA